MSRTHDVTISAFDLDRLEAELTAVTEQRDRMAEAIYKTIMENLHLTDGDDCTLKRLKDVIQFELPNE
jgi:hypothetical protein